MAGGPVRQWPAARRTPGTGPTQSGPHSGANGSASPTASMIGCSRLTVSSTTRPTSSASVVSSVALVGIGEQLGEIDLDATGDQGSGSARTHPPSAPDIVPLTSTPSETDSSRRSRSSGAPSSIAIRSSPMRNGLGTVSANGHHRPGPPPQPGDIEHERRSWTRGAPPTFACVAISDQSYGDGRSGLAGRVVVRSRGGAQLMPAAAHRTQGSVEEVLELGELAVDIDVTVGRAAGPPQRAPNR